MKSGSSVGSSGARVLVPESRRAFLLPPPEPVCEPPGVPRPACVLVSDAIATQAVVSVDLAVPAAAVCRPLSGTETVDEVDSGAGRVVTAAADTGPTSYPAA